LLEAIGPRLSARVPRSCAVEDAIARLLDLAMALSAETSEIVEHFQWLTEEQSKNSPSEGLAEAADLLAAFRGFSLDLSVVEDLTERLIDRRL
jgi:hypothetical protein